MFRSIHARSILLASVTALSTPALWALPSRYHVTYLGRNILGERINASGQAAVLDHSSGKGYQPALWSNGTVTDLPVAGFRHGGAYALNDAGVVVGVADSGGLEHAAMWPSASQFIDLGGLFRSKSSYVLGINNQGDCAMVAYVKDEAGQGQRTFFARGCTHPRNIGEIGGNYTYVERINNAGQLAGYSQVSQGATDMRAYLWTDGEMKLLGPCRNTTSSGSLGLNDQGHVVGFCNNGAYAPQGGFYYDGSELTRIGDLGGGESVALAINNADVIVGWSKTAGKQKHPFVLDRGAVPHRLHDLQAMLDSSGAGWALDRADDINDAGQILVHGTFQGLKNQYAILTPVD
jgi:probable HAF family extracellular repeat protein